MVAVELQIPTVCVSAHTQFVGDLLLFGKDTTLTSFLLEITAGTLQHIFSDSTKAPHSGPKRD